MVGGLRGHLRPAWDHSRPGISGRPASLGLGDRRYWLSVSSFSREGSLSPVGCANRSRIYGRGLFLAEETFDSEKRKDFFSVEKALLSGKSHQGGGIGVFCYRFFGDWKIAKNRNFLKPIFPYLRISDSKGGELFVFWEMEEKPLAYFLIKYLISLKFSKHGQKVCKRVFATCPKQDIL